MKLAQEFKEFVARGNVIDIAVGVIIGGAFGKIVSSLVEDIIMPFIGLFVGDGIGAMQILLKEGATPEANVYLKYGLFLQNVIDFFIIAFVIFMIIKGINKMKRKEEAKAEEAPAEPSEEVLLLREIRDGLKK